MKHFIVFSVCVTICLASEKLRDSPLDWWEKTVFYQIYPRSFFDTNDDGVGDLRGVHQKLPYLKETGIQATWLSPIFKSPMVDHGYDISDFRDIHYEFGTLEDFDKLLAEANKLGIKIILDFVPNHSSDQHEWFIKSANKTPGYEDYYVWKDGKNNNKDPPNNWISSFGGSAWEFNKQRNQWYLHQFAIQQPDLNYRSPAVVKEMKDILKFWMDRGVSGFRCDAVPHIFEDEEFKDEPLSNNPNAKPNDYAYLNHIYTTNHDQTFDMIYQWRELMDEYSKQEPKVMMVEAYADIKTTMRYYGNGDRNGAHFPFNFNFITDLNKTSNANNFEFVINKWMSNMPTKYRANWVLGNHDNHRFASRFRKEYVDGLNMMEMMLPGVGVTYNGDEWGQEDGFVSWKDTQDPQALNAGEDRYLLFTRDPERTPLHWDSTKNAGFSKANKTWLPVSDKYLETNLAKQIAPSESHYHVFVKMLKLRKENTLVYGKLQVKALSDQIIVLTREWPKNKSFGYVFNCGNNEEKVDLSSFNTIPEKANVVVNSVDAKLKIGTSFNTRDFKMGPYEAYVFSY